MAHPYWPLFDLVVRTPRLELRLPDRDQLAELAALAGRGVHDPSWQPFSIPWTDLPSPELERGVLQFSWSKLASWASRDWSFNPVVIVGGAVVGSQGMSATDFATVRVVRTGSWLGVEHQGKGIGKEMRAAILHLAFAGLGALRAESGYWEDNHASRRVSQSLGYLPNGDDWGLRRGVRSRQCRMVLPRELWEARRRVDIEIENLEPCLELFGATGAPGDDAVAAAAAAVTDRR